MVMSNGTRLVRVAKKTDPRLKLIGEAVGFLYLKRADAGRLRDILKKMVQKGKTSLEYEDSYNELMKKSRFGFKKIAGFWTEMDFEEDLKKISGHVRTTRRVAPTP